MRIDRGRRPHGGGCRLESGHTFTAGDGPSAGGGLLVLMRVHSGRVERVRAYTDDCVLDAEGRLVVWLEDVPPGESVALLKELLSDAARSEHMAEEALTALALHAAPEAVQALIDVAKRHASGDVRGGALFWLAQRAGDEARAAITRAIEEDPETEVKRQAVFAVSEMPDGVPLLIDLARRHKNPVVREQAFFWLGESEDPRALAFFEEVLGR
jgi:HEAT repeat protein